MKLEVRLVLDFSNQVSMYDECIRLARTARSLGLYEKHTSCNFDTVIKAML